MSCQVNRAYAGQMKIEMCMKFMNDSRTLCPRCCPRVYFMQRMQLILLQQCIYCIRRAHGYWKKQTNDIYNIRVDLYEIQTYDVYDFLIKA